MGGIYLSLSFHLSLSRYLPGRFNALSRKVPVAAAVTSTTSEIDFNMKHVKTEQKKEKLWSRLIYALASGDESILPDLLIRMRQFELQVGYLFRNLVRQNDVSQTAIPATLRTVLTIMHDSPQAGYPGRDRYVGEVRKIIAGSFYALMWRNIKICESCQAVKGATIGPSPILEYPMPEQPWVAVGIDILTSHTSHQGSRYSLVCVDHFSR